MRPLLALAALALPMLAGNFVGTVEEVHDGDTITVKLQFSADRHVNRQVFPVRLWLVDAPELAQPGGLAARNFLIATIQGKRIECVYRGKSYDRIVAECSANTRDVGTELVLKAHAWVLDDKGKVKAALQKGKVPKGYKAIRQMELYAKQRPVPECSPWVYRAEKKSIKKKPPVACRGQL